MASLPRVTLAVAIIFSQWTLQAAGPAPVNLGSAARFAILSGAAITTTGGGVIHGDVGASPATGTTSNCECSNDLGDGGSTTDTKTDTIFLTPLDTGVTGAYSPDTR